jgi:hypothetical protein
LSALVLLALLLFVVGAGAGCGGNNNSSGGGGTHAANSGIVWLSWTVMGQPVSDTTCKSVDHLVLTLETPAGTLEIEPIPCLRGLGLEYDGLPEGVSVAILDAFDSKGFATLEGVGDTTLTDTKPPMPSPIDLLAR